jgi:AraC-like DNA-binding protein
VFSILVLGHRPRFQGLSLLLGFEALLMVFNFSEETGLFAQTYLITPVFSLVTGPAFYLFIRQLVTAQTQWERRDLAHFLPMLLTLPFTSSSQLVLALGSTSLVVYGVLSYMLLRNYHQAAAQFLSDTQPVTLSWLFVVMGCFAFLGVTDIVRLNFQPYLDFELRNVWYLIHQCVVFVLFMFLVIRGLNQPELFDQLVFFEQELKSTADNVDAPIDNAVFEHIHQHMIEHEWFLQPKLSLTEVASNLGLGVKDVSGAITQGAQCNFSDYVNGLRVDAFKTALAAQTDAKPNMLKLALDAGFNSKSAFYLAFRRVEGKTPSQYWADR